MAHEHASELSIEEQEHVESLIYHTKVSLQKYKREAYFPVFEDGDSNLIDSKFGGTPFMQQGENWPICQCGYPMEFGVQINLDNLPFNRGELGNGLLQLWSCSQFDICDCYSIITRIIPIIGIQVLVSDISKMTCRSSEIFPAKRITGWTREDDYPYLEEIEEDDLNEEIWDELDERAAWEYPESEDKIGGWPCWRQHVKYPECPICQEEMTTLLLQIAGGSKNHKWDFDATGIGYIHQCPSHKDQVRYVYSR
jgi:uncharacterized protein YwqG